MEVEGEAITASGHASAAAAANLNRRMKTRDFTRSSLSLIQGTFEFKKQTNFNACRQPAPYLAQYQNPIPDIPARKDLNNSSHSSNSIFQLLPFPLSDTHHTRSHIFFQMRHLARSGNRQHHRRA